MSDRLADLRAARDLMWESLEDSDPEKRGPLMAQWRAIEKDIADLSKGVETPGDPIDEITARRAARGGATARKGHPARNQG